MHVFVFFCAKVPLGVVTAAIECTLEEIDAKTKLQTTKQASHIRFEQAKCLMAGRFERGRQVRANSNREYTTF